MRLLGELPTCPERCEDDDKGGWGRQAPCCGQQCRAKGPRRARPGHYGHKHRRRGDEDAGGLVATWPRVGAGRSRERGDEDLELEHEDLKYVELTPREECRGKLITVRFDGWRSLEG